MYNIPSGGGQIDGGFFPFLFRASHPWADCLSVSGSLRPSPIQSCLIHYELGMCTLVTHLLLEYRVTYRRLLEVQARLPARVREGEIGTRCLSPGSSRQ